MKTLFLLIVVIITAVVSQSDQDPQFSIKFKTIECYADNISVKLKHCFLKDDPEGLGFINIEGTSLQVIEKPIDLEAVIYIGLGPMFYPLMKFKIEWCSLMSGGEQQKIGIRIAMAVAREVFPGLIHECPYNGNYDIKNFTIPFGFTKFARFAPSGNYKIEINVYKDLAKIVSAGVVIEVVSSRKIGDGLSGVATGGLLGGRMNGAGRNGMMGGGGMMRGGGMMSGGGMMEGRNGRMGGRSGMMNGGL